MIRQKLTPVILLYTENYSYLAFFKTHFTPAFTLLHYADKADLLDAIKLSFADLIILDHKLGGDLITTLASDIRKIGDCKTTPILLITQSLKNSFSKDAFSHGVTDLIYPPLDFEEIQKKLLNSMKNQDLKEKISSLSSVIGGDASSTQKKEHHFTAVLPASALKAVTNSLKEKKPLTLIRLHVLFPSHENESRNASIVTLIKETLRKDDLLFPQENNSFYAILPKTTRRASHLIAEEIEKELKNHSYTIEIGFAYLEENTDENAFICLEKLLKEASHRINPDLMA